MLHMCRKSLVINLFFSQISGFYPFELRWVSKMFVHCIKPSSSIMYNLWKWSDGRGRKSCIDRRAQHGRHVPTLVGQCGIDKYVTCLREISIEHDVRRYKRIFFNIWPIVVWCQSQMSTLLSHPGIPGVTICFCTGSYAAAAAAAGRRFLSTW